MYQIGGCDTKYHSTCFKGENEYNVTYKIDGLGCNQIQRVLSKIKYTILLAECKSAMDK